MAHPAQASRIALLIGNGDYQNVPKLANPVNDAEDMAEVLKTLGFEVIVKLNASKPTMKKAVRKFGQSLHNGDVALFYYSGHGLQSDNNNYLVPVEADIKSDADIEFEAFNASRVFKEMEQVNKGGVNIMILDACRNNPFQSNSKNIKKGLAEMRHPVGSLLAYATAPNKVAYGDGGERNSIYTKYLLEGLREKPFLNVHDLLTEVTRQVVEETGGTQVPWQSSSLTQRFCFGRCGASPILDVSTCEQRFQKNCLTTGCGGETALACYTEVLEKDKNNAEALAGLKKIEAKYVTWIKNAWCKSQEDKARQYMKALGKVNPDSQELAAFEVLLEPFVPRPPVVTEPPVLAVPDKVVFRDRLQDGGHGPEMVRIAGGSFRMGEDDGYSYEKPVHPVTVKEFAVGRYEVTFAEYDKFAEATGRSKPDDRGWGRDNRPVINVSWHDAVAYTEWLSQQTGKKYRLPTEAEWEYAARAGTTTKYWWGNDIGSNKANCSKNYCGDSFQYTAPVGSFEANPFGLYDMVGNVWEWCADSWHGSYEGAPTDAQVWSGANENIRVLRGGSFSDDSKNVRATNRNRHTSAERLDSFGFRVVSSVGCAR